MPSARELTTPRTAPRRARRPLTHVLVLGLIGAGVVSYIFLPRSITSGSVAEASPLVGLALPGIGADARVGADAQTVLRPAPVPRTESGTAGETLVLGAAPAVNLPLTEPPTERQEAAATLEPALLPPYSIYEIQQGDTLTSVAARFGIDVKYLSWSNPGLHDPDALVPGNKLIIPAGNGILHEVRLGDTLSDIAGRYQVAVDDIVSFAPNRIKAADSIIETQLIYVPNGVVPEVALVAADPAGDGGGAAPAEQPVPDGSAGAPPISTGLIWPFSGPVSSYMGPGHPLGIDIDGYNNPGGAVAASTSGTVIFAGGSSGWSYGLYVVIRSSDGTIETLYAHLSEIWVVEGQTVAQGEPIGVVGCTGYCTGTHLHFEVIVNGVRVDPLAYLP